MSEVGKTEDRAVKIKGGKGGARIFGIRSELVLALFICEQVYQAFNAEVVLTSVIDGKHSKGSFHYNGLGVDLRTKNLNKGDAPKVVSQIKERLGDDFDVVLEGNHIHLEFQPKQPY